MCACLGAPLPFVCAFRRCQSQPQLCSPRLLAVQERKHFPELVSLFTAKVTRKSQFDDVWEVSALVPRVVVCRAARPIADPFPPAWQSPDSLEGFAMSDPGLTTHLAFLQRAQVRFVGVGDLPCPTGAPVLGSGAPGALGVFSVVGFF